MKSTLIQPATKPVNAVVVPPGSKSITNRALILAALCAGETVLTNVLDAEDTQIMFSALQQLGLDVKHFPAEREMRINGLSGNFPTKSGEIYIGNSGTTARFLTAMLAFSHGNYRLHGKPRMHQRPIRDLVDALKRWGADICYENDNGCPPLNIRRNDAGGQQKNLISSVSGSVSSQFLSAMLLSAPLAVHTRRGNVEIQLTGELVSKPYITMTLQMQKSFGIEPEVADDFSLFRFSEHQHYRTPHYYDVEPDASAASYFFAAAAVTGGSVTVQGLSRNSLQGDIAFVNALETMGCSVSWNPNSITVQKLPEKPLRGITVDMNSYSDTVQTLAVVALFADGATEITNVEHIRFKETDRIADLATELRRFGAAVEERKDGLKIVPPEQLIPATVETYDDHRMAMSFATAGLRVPGVVINHPDCVQKTFPNFFKELERIQ